MPARCLLDLNGLKAIFEYERAKKDRKRNSDGAQAAQSLYRIE